MTNPETALGGASGRFPSTSWSLFRQLRDGPSERRPEVLQRLITAYWKPVYCSIRYGWRKSNEEAKDLTQQFFLDAVLERSMADGFRPERGTFRAFLKGWITNFMRDARKAAGRQKRGGGTGLVSLDIGDVDVAELLPDPGAEEPDRVFDAAWKSVVFSKAVERVEERLRAEGKEAYFAVFDRYDLNPEGPDVSYQKVGEALNLKPDAVKNHLTRARDEFRRAVLEILAEYVDSEDDLSAEMEALFGA